MCVQNINDYIARNIHLFSYLSTFKDAKLGVLDQLLNVVGNGIRNNDEFIEHMKKSSNTEIPSLDDIKRLYEQSENKEKIFTGYTQVKVYERENYNYVISNEMPNNEEYLIIPHRESKIENIKESEKKNYPNVILWREKKEKKINWIPYPNFSEQYSTIWFLDFNLLGDLKEEWIKEFIWFYEESLAFFKSDKNRLFATAFPTGVERRDLIYIENFKSACEKYKTNEEISKAYNQEYNGDIEDFLTKRWKKEKEEYISFINDSIKKLTKELNEIKTQ